MRKKIILLLRWLDIIQGYCEFLGWETDKMKSIQRWKTKSKLCKKKKKKKKTNKQQQQKKPKTRNQVIGETGKYLNDWEIEKEVVRI